MTRCEHCGTPLVRSTCPDCQGYGMHWEMSQDWEWIDPAPVCPTCDGTGKRLKCPDHWCVGSRWHQPAREAVRA